jgi:DNA-binding response OmpR family regulator
LTNEKPTGNGGTGARLGGARADFVASLGRKIADLRGVLGTLEASPESSLARDELRRKLHALGSGARMLRFDRLAACVLDTESVLSRATAEGQIRPADLERVASALDELPALAWGEERAGDVVAPPSRASAVPAAPAPARHAEPASTKALTPDTVSVLVIGPEDLADMLVEEMGEGAVTADFEVERTEDLARARSVALAFAPDVVILDGDLQGAADFVEPFMDDPLTETATVLVVVGPGSSGLATRFTALGVAKVMMRPLPPGALQAACQEAVDQRDGKTLKMTLGEPTVAQLGERLAEEVRRALVDALDPRAQAIKVNLGDGTEVWGAMWGAIARVREVVSASTRGAVQWSSHGPEGALALAPMLSRGVSASDRAEGGGRNRDDSVNVSLAGRRVIVADDDPAVTWFIADLLRTAGCTVHEALDGRTALRMAYELSPELVVSDILMPGLDGFALCRALRRDVALRDTPIILLSWKEDLLQRVRELGASAAAYLRKESDARAILARVREVMRPRARIAARLHGEGEVRGRLDGLTVRTLLDLVVAARPAARVSVRDASFLYEVELRGGGIQRASRTSGDGTFLRGDRVIPAMLGVGAGRFVVASTKPSGEPQGATLSEQFAKPIAQARSALHATTGARMMTVAKVVLDEDDVSGYVQATPEPARDLVQRLARGQSPREIVLHGEVAPALVEDVLADLATRGAIVAVYRSDGTDAMRGEALDISSIMPDADGGKSSLVPPSRSSYRPALSPPPPPPPPPAEDRFITDPEPARRGESIESAVMDAVQGAPDESPAAQPTTEAGGDTERVGAAAGTPTAGGPSPDAKETSIPVTVEPTADLRKPAPATPARPRSPKPGAAGPDESPGFPRPLAIGLLVLGSVAAAIGARTWLLQRDGAAGVPTAGMTAPAVPEGPGVTYGSLPAGANVAPGQGLLSVAPADGVTIRVDGNEAAKPAKGKPLLMPLAPGVHLVAVGGGEKARSRILEIRSGRATNVNLDEL